MKSAATSGYLPTLDGWRAIAIGGVLVYHACTSLFYPGGPYANYDALRLIQTGGHGVDVFFAISGFLICTRLLQEQRSSGCISLWRFYVRRGFRILPPYFAYLAVLAALAVGGVLAVEGREFLGCALFIRNYYGPVTGHGWYTGHFWSLAVEEHFYLLWPAFLVACGSRRARPLVVLLALLVPAWRLLGYRLGWLPSPHEFSARTDLRLDALLWGCWAALLLDVPAYRAWITRNLTVWVWLAVVVAVAGLTVFEPPLERNCQSFLMPWLLLGTVLHPTWAFSRLLERASIRWVGRLSYSLYVWQQLWLLGSWREHRPFPLGPLQEIPLNLAATLACAVASYYLLERPLLQLGSRLARPVPSGAETAAAEAPASAGASAGAGEANGHFEATANGQPWHAAAPGEARVKGLP